MTEVDKNPPDPKDSSEKIIYKTPEFVLIDDREKEANGHQKQTHYDANGNPTDYSKTSASQSQGPFSLRFLCFLGFVFCTVFGLGLLLIATLATLMSLVFLLQNKELNRSVLSLWKLYVNVVVAGVGCFIGLFSPAIGIGLIAVYFSFSSEQFSSDVLKTIIKRFFKLN
jgi:hypothetical protein